MVTEFREHQGQLSIGREPQAQCPLANGQGKGPSMALALLTCLSWALGLPPESDVVV